VYAGHILGHDLVVGPSRPINTDWPTAMSWAGSLVERGYSDFTLPTLAELVVLVGQFPHLFRPEPYWSRDEAPAPAALSDAMVYHVYIQQAVHWGKIYDCAAIAVRRLSNINVDRRRSA